MTLSQEEHAYYRKCMEIYRELGEEKFRNLREAIEDLRDQAIQRISMLKEPRDITIEQGKLQALNEILNYRNIVSAYVEKFEEIEQYEK